MNKLLLALFLTLTTTAFASIWYVDGVNGNDGNDCKTRQTACKTIGHAISLATSDDTIIVGPATYPENLSIGITLSILGSGAKTTLIKPSVFTTVVAISNVNAHVTLSGVTLTAGEAKFGGGIYNLGTLTISRSTVSGNRTCCAGGQGGGIYNLGTLTVNNSTISGIRHTISALIAATPPGAASRTAAR